MKYHKLLLDNHFPAEFSAHLITFFGLICQYFADKFPSVDPEEEVTLTQLSNYPTTQLHLLQMIPTPPPTSTHSQMKAPFIWATGTGQEGLASHYKALKIWLILLGILILIPAIFVK